MSKAEEYRQYAEEAMRWARAAKTEAEQLALLDLARTWTQAAQHRESVAVPGAGPAAIGGQDYRGSRL